MGYYFLSTDVDVKNIYDFRIIHIAGNPLDWHEPLL